MARRWVRRIGVCALALGAGGIVMSPADAHDPVFFTDDQTTPEAGPVLPDGTISFALYGDLAGSGDTRGFQVAFEEGDGLLIDLLIPALPPEIELADDELPTALVTAPDGTTVSLLPELRERFDEPFSNTSYGRLSKLEREAQAGTYDVVITGAARARFTIAVGTIETFLTPVERVENRPSNAAEIGSALADWYTGTPEGEPVAAAPTTVPPPTTTTAAPAPDTTLPEQPTTTETAGTAAASSASDTTEPDDESKTGTIVVTLIVVATAAAAVVATIVIARRR